MTKLFTTGEQYPPERDIPRLARYKRGRIIFDGRHPEIYDRASSLLQDTPHVPQLQPLFIAVNLMDILLTQPADLLTGEPPTFESGTGAGSREQERLDFIVEENDLVQATHELVVGGGFRGDSYLKRTLVRVQTSARRKNLASTRQKLRLNQLSRQYLLISSFRSYRTDRAISSRHSISRG